MPPFVAALIAKPWALALIAVVVLGGGYYVFVREGSDQGATLTLRAQDFKAQVNISGSVVAAEHVELGFAEGGRIAGVYVKVGERAWAGAVLASLENGDLAAAVAQKEAALETERAKLLSLEDGTRPEQITIDEAAVTKYEAALRDSIRSAYVSADDAVHKKADQFFTNPRTPFATLTFSVSNAILKTKVEQERIQLEEVFATWAAEISAPSFTTSAPEPAAVKARQYMSQVATFLSDASDALAQGQSVSTSYQTDISTARTTIASALSALSTAEGALATARGDLALARAGTSASDIAAQAAQVKAAEANVAAARADLAKTVIIAPFSGVVAKVDVKRGEAVSANNAAISLLSTGAFEIETFIPQINISSVSLGNPATITLDAYGPTVTFTAKVISIDPAETIRDGVATYKTMLLFDTADNRIRSGMTAQVLITTAETPGAIVIPLGAVFYENGQAYVRLSDGTARAITQGGASSLGLIEVREGLVDGDVILLSP